MGTLIGVLVVLLLVSNPVRAAELAEIRQRGYLIVAVKDNLPPFGFRDAQGQLQGLEIDLARQLAYTLLGREDAVVLQPVTNRERLQRVETGQVDVAIARVTATAPRFRLVNFSTPYYLDGTGILVNNPALWRLSDLGGRRVAVLSGSSTIASLRFVLPTVQMVGVSSYQEAYGLLQSGRVEGVAADASVLSHWAHQFSSGSLLLPRLSAEPLAIVLPKGLQHETLRQRVNTAIAQWQATGWLAARIRFWGLPAAQPLKSNSPQFDRLEENQ
jgi:polar amino acid transport system substrate-binding protein